MLDTKVAAGYLEALAPHVRALKAVRIPGEAASLPAETAAAHATRAGIDATPAGSVMEALQAHIPATKEPGRILICGSRSAERSGGKACVSTCRSRGSPNK